MGTLENMDINNIVNFNGRITKEEAREKNKTQEIRQKPIKVIRREGRFYGRRKFRKKANK